MAGASIFTAQPSVLAALVTPWLFYAGSAAVGIPVIIHLLAKRRFKRVRWAALDFLILAEKQNRRKINLQQLILLALRCLAIFLLGLMLARPYFSPSGLAGVLGASANRERIFVLDDSFSMAYRQGTASTFERGKAALVELLEWCHKQSPRDKLTILRTSDPNNRIADGRIVADGALTQLIAEVEALRPAQQPARFAELLVQLNDELQQSPDRLDTAVYIISDFQKKDWVGGPGSLNLADPLSAASEEDGLRLCPLAAVADWPEQERELDMFLVQVAGQNRPNVAVTKLTTPQPQLVAGIENRLIATIGNFSHDTIEPFEMGVFLGGASQPAIAVPAIAPGQSVDVAFDTSFPEKGFAQMRVEIPADALGADDQRMAVWKIQPAIKVLLVNGEPSTTTADDEVALLRTALRPEGEVYSGFQVAVADASELDGVNLDEVHLLMLANVYRLSDDAVGRMEDYVRRGGGLVVFLGDQVDAELYNQRLWKNGAGLLPCQLARVLSIARGQTAPTLTGGDWTHPLMKIFGGAQNPFLSNLAFWQYFECILAQPTQAATGGSSASGHGQTRVVARFSDQDHNPAIIEKSFGRGMVILFASSADVEWNNWPKRPSYPVTVQELGQHAAKPNPRRTDVLVGDPIRMTLEPARYQPEVTVRTPAYPSEAEAVVNAAPTAAGGAYELLWPKAGQVGIYQLRLTRADGQREQVLLSADLDAEESNLASCNETDLRRCAPEVDFVYATDVSAIVGRTDETLRELWPGVLIAVVGLLMLEQTLACWFGRSS